PPDGSLTASTPENCSRFTTDCAVSPCWRCPSSTSTMQALLFLRCFMGSTGSPLCRPLSNSLIAPLENATARSFLDGFWSPTKWVLESLPLAPASFVSRQGHTRLLFSLQVLSLWWRPSSSSWGLVGGNRRRPRW